jgi:hypothetical protein
MQKDVSLEQVLDLVTNLSLRDKVRLIEYVAPQIEREIAAQPVKPLRSLYGLWKGFSISEEEIAKARREMWSNFGDREF